MEKILLPKKDAGPDPASATRAPAGVLLAQEQHAELPKPQKPSTPAAPPPPPPAPPESGLKPLQTFKGDIESVVEDKKLSAVSIAAVEADRTKAPSEPGTERSLRALGYTLGGVALIAAALGLLAWVFSRPTSVPGEAEPQAPFIYVDHATPIAFDAMPNRGALMSALTDARKKVALSLGLIEWVYLTLPTDSQGGLRQLSASELIQTLAPQAPDDLLRVLRPTYLIGVHSFDENQPLLLLQVDSYEVAYAGMLGWERTMEGDLRPFFARSPSPRIIPADAATSTAATTTPDTRFIQTRFVDKVVENRDARVLLNRQGDLLLLWTFMGRNTVLITTNEYTLREVVSRMNQTPIVPTGQ